MRWTAVLLALFWSTQVQATDYWVATNGSDSNNGLTTGTAWLTWSKAVASACSPGDTVTFRNGTYTTGQVIFNCEGTVGARITFQAENQHLAIIASTSSCNPSLNFNKSYVTLDGFRLTVSASDALCTSGTTANYHIQMWPASLARVTGPTTTPKTGGIIKNFQIDDNNGHRYGAVKISQDDGIIENSTVYDEIEVLNTNNSIVRGNIVYASTNGIFTKGGARNTRIYNNVVHITGGSFVNGIMSGGCTGDPWFWDPTTKIEAYNTAIYNNVIINDHGSTSNTGIRFRSSSNSKAFNNAIINVEPFEFSRSSCSTNPPSNANPVMVNNIAKDVTGGTSYSMGSVTDFSGSLTINFNNIHGYSNAHSQSNAISGDPLFVNNTSDWHLQTGSPSLGTGTVVTMSAYPSGSITIAADPDGTERPVSGWDAGVYQTPAQAPPSPDPGPFRMDMSFNGRLCGGLC